MYMCITGTQFGIGVEASPSGLWRRTANAVWVYTHRGFKSLRLRCVIRRSLDFRIVRERARSSTDRASDYGSEGLGFESLRAHFSL